MEPENYHKYSRYGSWAISLGVLLLVCSFVYFIALQKKSAELQKKTADSVILGLRKIHSLDSSRHVKDSINLSLKTALSNTLNQDNVSKQPADVHSINKTSVDAAKAINNYNDKFWIYLGQVTRGNWNPKNFVFDDEPKPGDFILATVPVYKRDILPQKLPDNNWQLGKITGAVNGGTLVKVDAIQKLEDNNYWAQAELYNWVIIMGGNSALDAAQQNFTKFKNAGITSLVVFRQGTYRNISQPFKTQEEATAFINQHKGLIPADAYVVRLSSWLPILSFNGSYYLDNSKSNRPVFSTEFIRTNIGFSLDGKFVPGIAGTLTNSANKMVSFNVVDNADRKISWTAYLPDGNYTITLTDGRYKLPNNKYTFSFSASQVSSGIALIQVPISAK